MMWGGCTNVFQRARLFNTADAMVFLQTHRHAIIILELHMHIVMLSSSCESTFMLPKRRLFFDALFNGS